MILREKETNESQLIVNKLTVKLNLKNICKDVLPFK